jgi:hypothetical protein
VRRVYHITHIDNLPAIVSANELLPDAARQRGDFCRTDVGMARIKNRRHSLPVPPHPGTHVGDYVPFYFCPRSARATPTASWSSAKKPAARDS